MLTVAVLGLGPLGAGMAERLGESHQVRTWSRTPRPHTPGWRDSAAAAVAGADVVLVVVHDATACHSVLEAARPALGAGVTIVNASTVGPDEALELAELVEEAGATYLHAPVIGSSVVAGAGGLAVLAGGPVEAQVASVLDELGTTIHTGTIRASAALKLIANGVLADAMVILRRSLLRAEADQLPIELVLDVLAKTPIAGPTAAKRAYLLAPDADHDVTFAIDTLAKDLDLLASLTGSATDAALLMRTLTRAGDADGREDVAGIATRHQPSSYAAAHLDVSPEIVVDPEVMVALHAYAMGQATNDPLWLRRAFWPTAHADASTADQPTPGDLATYCEQFSGTPAPDEATRRRRVEQLLVVGDVATATMTLHHGPDTFTDMFVLRRERAGNWRIASQVRHRH